MADFYTLAKEDTTRLVGAGISAHQPGLLVTRDGRLMRHQYIPLVYGTMIYYNMASDGKLQYNYTRDAAGSETETLNRYKPSYGDYWHDDNAYCKLNQTATSGNVTTIVKEMCQVARDKLSVLDFRLCDPARLVQEFQPVVLKTSSNTYTRWTCVSTVYGQILGAAQREIGANYAHLECIGRMEALSLIPEWVGFPGTAGGCRVPIEISISGQCTHRAFRDGIYLPTTVNPILSVFHFADEWTNELPVGPCKLYAQYQLPAMQFAAENTAKATLTTSVDIALPPDRIIGLAITPCSTTERLWDYLSANLDTGVDNFSSSSLATQTLTNPLLSMRLETDIIVRTANIGG